MKGEKEMKNRKEISIFVRRAFLRLLPVQIAGILVGTINAFVDNVFTGQFLGTEAMAAMSFFAPVVTMICVLFVIVSGVHILCGKHLGAGEGDAVLSLFSTEVVFLSLCCIGVSVVCILYRHPLAHLLGAQNRTAALLSDYIAGYAPGIIGLVLSGNPDRLSAPQQRHDALLPWHRHHGCLEFRHESARSPNLEAGDVWDGRRNIG